MLKAHITPLFTKFSNSKVGLFLLNKKFASKFQNSSSYWEHRYRNNGNSGPGSYGAAAGYKATILNRFVKEHAINKVVEFGCGDGNQLKLYEFNSYIGYDVADSCVQKCKMLFENEGDKLFFLYNPACFKVLPETIAHLTISIDVVYHLIEDNIYHFYMNHLFETSEKYVIIYAWDVDSGQRQHVKHRKFSKWIETYKSGWQLSNIISSEPKGKHCDFFIYKKVSSSKTKE